MDICQCVERVPCSSPSEGFLRLSITFSFVYVINFYLLHMCKQINIEIKCRYVFEILAVLVILPVPKSSIRYPSPEPNLPNLEGTSIISKGVIACFATCNVLLEIGWKIKKHTASESSQIPCQIANENMSLDK